MTSESFQDFLARREAASVEFINGRPQPFLDLVTQRDPATFFPPNGERIVGPSDVMRTNRQMASGFDSGSTGTFEILQSGSDRALGFWTGIHRARVNLSGRDEPVEMELRTTEIFRREEGGWRLIHRHADLLHSPGGSA